MRKYCRHKAFEQLWGHNWSQREQVTLEHTPPHLSNVKNSYIYWNETFNNATKSVNSIIIERLIKKLQRNIKHRDKELKNMKQMEQNLS